MRMSTMFGRTLRETPADAELISHKLLLRAGMIRPLGTGIFTFMPLGWRVLYKIQAILRQEMDAIGAQELLLILLVILLLFGAKKIPEMAQGLGKGMREFRKAMKDTQDELTKPQPSTEEKKADSEEKKPGPEEKK